MSYHPISVDEERRRAVIVQADILHLKTRAPWDLCLRAHKAGQRLWLNPLTAEWEIV